MDVGRARIGVARTDADATLALPLVTVQRGATDGDFSSATAQVAGLASEYSAVELIVGLPLNMRGEFTASTHDSIAFAHALGRLLTNIPIRLLDERLSTVSASKSLSASGLNTRKQRPVIDQQAAVVLLEQALSVERSQGVPPGRPISEFLE